MNSEPYPLQTDDYDYDISFISYINDAGDEFVFYPDGRFYSYENSSYEDAEDKGLTDEEFNELAYNALKAAVPDIDEFTAGSPDEYRIWKYTKAGVCEETNEAAFVCLNNDGSIVWLRVNRNNITDASVVEKLQETAQANAEKRWKDMSDFNYVRIEYPYEFFTVDGKNYGIFSYVISSGDPEAIGCYRVLACDD